MVLRNSLFKLFIPSLFLLFSQEVAYSQAFAYQIDQSPLIIKGGDTLSIPWGRGLNSPQVQNIDLNLDGKLDLICYDRSGYDFHTFINHNDTEWRFDPRYGTSLPNLQDGWIVVADADCDSILDLYVYGPAGPSVFKNIPGSGFSHWALFESTLFYLDSFGWSNMIINQGDYPSILDVDGDGDTDILAFEWLSGGFLQYYKNMSVELNGNCDSMIYVLEDYCWGRFHECPVCGQYDIDLDSRCLVNGTTDFCRGGSHSGSTSLSLDLNDDGLLDILLGDIGCVPIVSMRNKGSSSLDVMDSARLGFPQYDVPATGFFYPAMFHVDVNFDGKRDLIVTPNTQGNPGNNYRLDESIWYYEDISQVDSPDFNFTQTNFLQDQMLDVGDFSSPALADYDGDGDLDLFVGNGGRNFGGDYYSNLAYLENTGDSNHPEFTYNTSDFMSLVSGKYWNIRPLFQDLSGDGIVDFGFAALDSNGISSLFRYYENQGVAGGQMILDPSSPLTYGGVDTLLSRDDMPHFADISGDGNLDLLIARDVLATITYFKNSGTTANPDWQLEEVSLGNIGNFFGDQGTNVQVGDFNRDGKLDLAYGIQDGKFRIYDDFVPGIYGKLVPYSSLVYNSLVDSLVSDMLGSSIFLAPGDLDGDNGIDWIMGSTTGGIQYIRYADSLVSGLEKPKVGQGFQLKIWPNPAQDLVNFDYPGTPERVEVISLGGRSMKVLSGQDLNPRSIETYDLPQGVYLIKVSGNNGPGIARLVKINP